MEFILGIISGFIVAGIVVAVIATIKDHKQEFKPVKEYQNEWLWQKYAGITMRPLGSCPVDPHKPHTMEDVAIEIYWNELESAYDFIRDHVIVQVL